MPVVKKNLGMAINQNGDSSIQDKEKLIAELEDLLEKQRKIEELELNLKKEKESYMVRLTEFKHQFMNPFINPFRNPFVTE